jgi:hypothetical protein
MSRRKQERRKFGLDMQAYKDKKVLLAERKEVRVTRRATTLCCTRVMT